MYPKTERHELSRAFLWQISIFTVLVLAAVVFFSRFLVSEKTSIVPDTQTMLFPWLVAGRHAIENGLLAFSGKAPQEVKIYELARALAALLVSSVICPTVFLLEWRRRRLTHVSGENPRPLSLSMSFYGLCAAMTLYFAVAILPMTASSETTRSRLRAAQAIQSNRDSVINEINSLAISAYQHYILPAELGGGGRTYDGFVLPEGMSRTAAARYSVAPARNEMMIRVASVAFEDCSIEAKLDSTGSLARWNYSGRY